MKQVSHPPFLGIADHKKWSPVFIWASEDPPFCTQKRPFSVILGAKKRVLGRPNQKTETTFCRQLYLNMVDETLVSYGYHYWVSYTCIKQMSLVIAFDIAVVAQKVKVQCYIMADMLNQKKWGGGWISSRSHSCKRRKN